MVTCCHGNVLSWWRVVMVTCCHGNVLSWWRVVMVKYCHVVMVTCCHCITCCHDDVLWVVMVTCCHGLMVTCCQAKVTVVIMVASKWLNLIITSAGIGRLCAYWQYLASSSSFVCYQELQLEVYFNIELWRDWKDVTDTRVAGRSYLLYNYTGSKVYTVPGGGYNVYTHYPGWGLKLYLLLWQLLYLFWRLRFHNINCIDYIYKVAPTLELYNVHVYVSRSGWRWLLVYLSDSTR